MNPSLQLKFSNCSYRELKVFQETSRLSNRLNQLNSDNFLTFLMSKKNIIPASPSISIRKNKGKIT